MTVPISIRLDDAVRVELERAAKESGKALATLVRDALGDVAREMRRERIRRGTAAVAAHAVADPEARAFLADWGTPNTDA